jgi:2-polyprenyl-6-methoxyphenol hydroxylase-like FAD-dependent oxidoreductase
VATSATPLRSENIVIAGAGVAGLATAVALRQLSVGAVVLEQGPTLHAGGTSLTLFKNGWHVLDAVGVADELRTKYLRIQGCVIYSLKRNFFLLFSWIRCVF